VKKQIKWISKLLAVAFFLVLPGQAQKSVAPPAGAGAPPSNPLRVALLRWYAANTTTTFTVGTQPRGVCFDGANIWVANYGSNSVTKLAANDGTVLGTYAVGSLPAGVAFDGANIWVTNFGSNNVTKLRASDGTVLGTFSVGATPFGIVFDGTNIWVGGGGVVTKLRASDGKVLGTFTVNGECYGAAFDGTYVWFTNGFAATVTRFKQDGTNAGVFTLGGEPFGIAFDGTNIWVGNSSTSAGTVNKLLAKNGTLLGTFTVGGGVGYGVAFDGNYIYVTTSTDLVQLRVSDGTVLHTIPTTGGSTGVTFDGANLWVAEYDVGSISKM
jgi:hypothetical protein